MSTKTHIPRLKLVLAAGVTCASLVLALPIEAATLTYENSWNYDVPSGISSSGTDFYASTNDLANAGQSTLLSAVWSGGTSGPFDSSPAQLNNGFYAPAYPPPNETSVNAIPTDSTLLATPDTTYTISFNGGMDISSIVVYAAMADSARAKQNWKLEYRVVGSEIYTPIVDPFVGENVAQNSNGNRQGPWFNKVTLTPAEGELLNVDSLRFTFLQPVYNPPTDGGNSTMLETGYREIDVFGTPVPTSDYNSWALGYGLDPALSSGPTAGAVAADPDGDSFTNGLEFAFGTSPIVGNGPLLNVARDGGTCSIAWLERIGGSVTYQLQDATNLAAGPWFVSSEVPITPGAPAPAGYVWKAISVATGGATKFYRVVASF